MHIWFDFYQDRLGPAIRKRLTRNEFRFKNNDENRAWATICSTTCRREGTPHNTKRLSKISHVNERRMRITMTSYGERRLKPGLMASFLSVSMIAYRYLGYGTYQNAWQCAWWGITVRTSHVVDETTVRSIFIRSSKALAAETVSFSQDNLQTGSVKQSGLFRFYAAGCCGELVLPEAFATLVWYEAEPLTMLHLLGLVSETAAVIVLTTSSGQQRKADRTTCAGQANSP